jgi:hypothetical protein
VLDFLVEMSDGSYTVIDVEPGIFSQNQAVAEDLARTGRLS